MKRFAVTLPLAALLLGGAATVLSAQGATNLVVDRVVAVVGKTPILDSQVDERLFQQMGGPSRLPTDSLALKTLRRQFLDSLINEELMYQQAQADTTVKVSEQETSDATDQVVKNVRKQLPSQVDFIAELKVEGWQSEDDWRRYLMQEQHRTLMINAFRTHLQEGGKLKPLPPNEREMRDFYDRMKGGFDSLPPTISIKQIVVAPKATPEAKAKARAFADSIGKELRKGDSAAFANAAKRYSMDPSSAVNGGELGWARRAQYVPEFERAVFSLKPGFISDPIETPYGYHIIQVSRVNAGEVKARHILIIPAIDSAGAKGAHTLIDSLYAALQRGATFDSLQFVHQDPVEEKVLEDIPMPSLEAKGPDYVRALAGVDSGQTTKPFSLPGNKWAIVRVLSRHPAGPVSFEALSDRIKQYLGKQNSERNYINSLRAKTYIEIKDP
jgi:peptidyl-prolyl cis-trans isomerase SurA